jgi:hypothetical protein
MTDHRHDFDFIFGTWHVHNRKLRDVTDPGCEAWVEFDATSEATPMLDGYGHVDRIFVPAPPDGDPFEGFTLRLYDPAAETWQIWWSSTRAPGRLDVPVVGRFDGDRGSFQCRDTVGGQDVIVRFEWTADQTAPMWRQTFSPDDGATWRDTWEMSFARR